MYLECLYINACSMTNKHYELKVWVISQSYDITDISETWWNESCSGNSGMEGYRLFRRDRQGRQGGDVALYVRERFECTTFTVSDDVCESLWVRTRRMVNKGNVVVGVYYRSPSQMTYSIVSFWISNPCPHGVIDGLAGLVKCKTKDKLGLKRQEPKS